MIVDCTLSLASNMKIYTLLLLWIDLLRRMKNLQLLLFGLHVISVNPLRLVPRVYEVHGFILILFFNFLLQINDNMLGQEKNVLVLVIGRVDFDAKKCRKIKMTLR